MIRQHSKWFLVIAALVVLAGTAGATSIAADYLGGGSTSNFGPATGYFFTPSEDLLVTALGIFDAGTLGFADSHEVGIFMTDGTPVVTAALASGLSGTFVPATVEGTRFVPVTPAVLSGGTQYYIVGDNFQTDAFHFGVGAVSFAPEITWDGFGDGSTNSIFSTVTNFGGQPGNLGPNFEFQVVIPEPGTAILMLTGFVGLVAWRRRR